MIEQITEQVSMPDKKQFMVDLPKRCSHDSVPPGFRLLHDRILVLPDELPERYGRITSRKAPSNRLLSELS